MCSEGDTWFYALGFSFSLGSSGIQFYARGAVHQREETVVQDEPAPVVERGFELGSLSLCLLCCTAIP